MERMKCTEQYIYFTGTKIWTSTCLAQYGWYCKSSLQSLGSGTHSMIQLASFPGCLPLCFLDRIHDLWTARRSGRRPGIPSTSSNCKVDSIMTYVDSVSVIMSTCPRCYCTFLRVLLRSPQTNGSGLHVSYCWLLRYCGGPSEASGTDPLIVLLL